MSNPSDDMLIEQQRLQAIRNKFSRIRRMTYLFLFLGLFLFVALGADFLARGLIFHPPKYPEGGDWKPEGVEFEEVFFPVAAKPSSGKTSSLLSSSSVSDKEDDDSDGEAAPAGKEYKLCGWYFAHPHPKVVLLYCHGNASNVADFGRFGNLLRRRYDASVLIFDYRGYGKSEGKPTTKGILRDGRAALSWLAKRENIRPEQIVVWGQSLGGSVAVDLAAEVGARGLIVESSFTSLADVVKKNIVLGVPAKLLREKLPSVQKISRYKGPVFISHGKADQVIPFSHGERLFAAANEPKTFFVPPEGSDEHSAPLTEEHIAALDAFFQSLPASRPAK